MEDFTQEDLANIYALCMFAIDLTEHKDKAQVTHQAIRDLQHKVARIAATKQIENIVSLTDLSLN